MTKLQKLFKAYSKGTKSERQLEKLMRGINDYLVAVDFHKDCMYTWGSFQNVFGYVNTHHVNLEVGNYTGGIRLIYKDGTETVYDWDSADEVIDEFIYLNTEGR